MAVAVTVAVAVAVALVMLTRAEWASGAPNYHGCQTEAARRFRYCNVSLSIADRVEALLVEMTLEERVGMIAPDPSLGSSCFAHIHGVPRLELPPYGWLVEMNTGVASECLGPNQCATTFAGPTGLGAAFNRTMWAVKGTVLSTEMRAFSNANWYRAPSTVTSQFEYIGTSAFGPNLNIIRDPRYGRNAELPGEDPFLTGEYGTAYVKALQTKDANGHPRVSAYVKHFTAYSTETNRMHSDYNVSLFDYGDTYLPQYKKVFTEARAAGAMCSYAAENGHPSCANDWLLNTVLRNEWNRPDAFISTDCGAVKNTMGPPLNLKSAEEAAAVILNGGTDLEMGTTIFNSSMLSAVSKGLATEETVTAAARRNLFQRFRQGDFDPVHDVAWSSIPASVVNSSEHQDIAFEAALQAVVLLKNSDNTLPLKAGTRIAVVGPGALAQKGLVGPYFGDALCYAPEETRKTYTYDCIPTIGAEIAAANVGGNTSVVEGIQVTGFDASKVQAAVDAAQSAEAIVLTIGIDHSVETEGHDAPNTSLPGLQESFAKKILELGKPTVLVLLGDDGIGIDNLVDSSSAILRAFYPGMHGAKALASLLFGHRNRWGKLPVTMYPSNYIAQLPKMGVHTGSAYAMAHPPGRSYRYFNGTPLFPFGRGLSLTTFTLSCATVEPLTRPLMIAAINVNCTVTNTGSVTGDEVVLVFHSVGDAIRTRVSKLHPVPLKQLVGFDRVGPLAPSGTQQLMFKLDPKLALSITAANGSKVLYSGEHKLLFSTGVPDVPDVVVNVEQ